MLDQDSSFYLISVLLNNIWIYMERFKVLRFMDITRRGSMNCNFFGYIH